MQDRRQFTRIHFDAAAQVTRGDDAFETDLMDISLNGALIALPDELRMDAGDQCVLRLPLDDAAAITMQGHIAHVEAGAAGLQCETIDVDSITYLRRLVEQNLLHPDALERELAALWREHRAAGAN